MVDKIVNRIVKSKICFSNKNFSWGSLKAARRMAVCSVFSFLLLSGILNASGVLKEEKKSPADWAKEFVLSSLEGKEISLSSFKGKPVILFFWTTWCPSCRTELSKVLSKEYPKMKARGISFLAIDVGEPKYRVESFLRGQTIEFPVLLDTDSQVSSSYSIIGIPTFFLIDARGSIKFMGNELTPDYINILSPNKAP